jgi:hypothetical protein
MISGESDDSLWVATRKYQEIMTGLSWKYQLVKSKQWHFKRRTLLDAK